MNTPSQRRPDVFTRRLSRSPIGLGPAACERQPLPQEQAQGYGLCSHLTQNAARCIALCIIGLLLVACGVTPTVTREPVVLKLAATEPSAPLLDDLTGAYHAEYPHVSFQVTHYDTSDGAVAAVVGGQVDLAAVVEISTTEMIWLTPLALDNMAIVVHPTNPITTLNLLQVRHIFHGRISAWNEVGGRQEDITVITRERGSDARAEIERRVLEGRNVTLNAMVAPSAEAVLDMVSTINTAIGYVSMSRRPAGVKMVAVDDVAPTPFSAADRSYPIHRPIYLVALQEPQANEQANLRDFVTWALDPDGQQVVSQRYGRVR